MKALDRSKPFQEVFGVHHYRYKQGNVIYDEQAKPIGLEGDQPTPEQTADAKREEELRKQIEAEVRAKIKTEQAEADARSAQATSDKKKAA